MKPFGYATVFVSFFNFSVFHTVRIISNCVFLCGPLCLIAFGAKKTLQKAMEATALNTIWTIGHSSRTLHEFVGLLKAFDIQLVADIRSFPGSRRYPHFNKEALTVSLPENDIRYIHILQLGGRRKVKRDSVNTGWRHPAFRGYADYMETDDFSAGVHELQELARK